MPFSIGAMILFALIVWQALGFPEVEDPIPDRIGFGFIVSLAGACGVVGGVLSAIAWPRRREQFISGGTLIGFWVGTGFYALSLIIQVASGS